MEDLGIVVASEGKVVAAVCGVLEPEVILVEKTSIAFEGLE